MKKETFGILALMIGGMAMIIWTFFGKSNFKENTVDIQGTRIVGYNFNNFSGTEINGHNDIEKATNEISINVMMPRYFYTQGWKNFAQDLYNEKKIFINFLFMDELNNYRKIVSESGFSGADVMLVPYDWTKNMDIDNFAFSQSIAPAFDEMIKPIVKETQISFLPFAADPMIMYSLSGIEQAKTFYELGDLIYDWAPPRMKSIPIFFGLIDDDFYDEGLKREYQDIVRYTLMHYFISNNDSSSLEARIESNILQNYSKKSISTISEIIGNSIENCTIYPSICFQLYKFVGIRFGFLSDGAIVKQYFNTKTSSFNDLLKSKMPFVDLESPIRIRGRVIPKSLTDIDTINSVYLLLNKYINNADLYSLHNNTLPVLVNSNQSLSDSPFIGKNGYILDNGGNFIEQQKSQRAFQQLIDYQISVSDYIRKI